MRRLLLQVDSLVNSEKSYFTGWGKGYERRFVLPTHQWIQDEPDLSL